MFSADRTEDSTLLEAHIHWLDIRCGLYHVSQKYLTSISQVSHKYLTSISQVSHKYLTSISQVSHKYLTSISQVSHKLSYNLSRASIYRLELSVWVTSKTEVIVLSEIRALNNSLALSKNCTSYPLILAVVCYY